MYNKKGARLVPTISQTFVFSVEAIWKVTVKAELPCFFSSFSL